jgi:Putative rhamnosyl transferase
MVRGFFYACNFAFAPFPLGQGRCFLRATGQEGTNMENKLKTVGLLRFSVLTPTYYSERFDTLEKTAAHIFSPERMALRFRIFENLCLPSLVRQSDADFDCVVLTAASMPAQYLDRLRDLLAPLANIHLMPVGTDKHYQLLKSGYNSVPVGDCTHRIEFRLDDDDAVDLDFVRRTKRLANGLLELQGPDTPFIIACNRGFYVRKTNGETEVFDACERAPLSAGTALVARIDHPANPYRFNHRRLAQHYNTFSDISVPGFIRTIHGDNKSDPTLMGITHKMKAKTINDQLIRHFGASMDDLAAL